MPRRSWRSSIVVTVAHLTTVDVSLRYLLLPQLEAVVAIGGESIGISAPGEEVDFLEERGIRHVPLKGSTRSMSLRSDLRAIRDLRRVLKRVEVDVLHTHNPKPGIYGRIVGRLSGVPIVVNTVHGFYATESDSWPKRALVYALEWVASLFSDAELVQSAEDVAMMRRWGIGWRSHVSHLGNGIDLDRFAVPRPGPHRDVVRAELGIDDPDTVVVGCVARLVAEKGIQDLVDAWRQRESDYRLVVVGPWDPTKADAVSPEVVREAEAEGIRFLGPREDVHALYQGWDVFVLPSYREGFPRAAMEAAASGLPLVATDIRGCREVVDQGDNGFLVPPGSPESLARAIGRLVEDTDLRAAMGERGAQKARSDFDERRVVRRVMDCYREVARRKGLEDLERELGPAGGSG